MSGQFDIGRWIWYCRKDIQSGTEIARKAFMDKRIMFTSKMNSELIKES